MMLAPYGITPENAEHVDFARSLGLGYPDGTMKDAWVVFVKRAN